MYSRSMYVYTHQHEYFCQEIVLVQTKSPSLIQCHLDQTIFQLAKTLYAFMFLYEKEIKKFQ